MPGNWKKKTFVPVDHFPDFNLESATIIIKNMFIMKNLTDFRKTVETGLDPRLAADGIIGVSDIAGCPQDENWTEMF